jgi:hypothetical protein
MTRFSYKLDWQTIDPTPLDVSERWRAPQDCRQLLSLLSKPDIDIDQALPLPFCPLIKRKETRNEARSKGLGWAKRRGIEMKNSKAVSKEPTQAQPPSDRENANPGSVMTFGLRLGRNCGPFTTTPSTRGSPSVLLNSSIVLMSESRATTRNARPIISNDRGGRSHWQHSTNEETTAAQRQSPLCGGFSWLTPKPPKSRRRACAAGERRSADRPKPIPVYGTQQGAVPQSSLIWKTAPLGRF